MNEPDGSDDTEPMGGPDACADDTEPGLPPEVDTVLEEQGLDGEDADDFWRWLPTMWLVDRRRKELVERASSDGAKFAAYACEGRPARASVPPPREATVQVQLGPPRLDAAFGEAGDEDRNALTVVKPRETHRTAWRLAAVAAIGVVAMGAVIAARARRSPLALSPSAASFAAAPVQVARTESQAVASVQPPPGPSFHVDSDAPPPGATVPSAHASQRPVRSLRFAAPRRIDAPATGTAEGERLARSRSPQPTATSALPTKDEFFEVP